MKSLVNTRRSADSGVTEASQGPGLSSNSSQRRQPPTGRHSRDSSLESEVARDPNRMASSVRDSVVAHHSRGPWGFTDVTRAPLTDYPLRCGVARVPYASSSGLHPSVSSQERLSQDICGLHSTGDTTAAPPWYVL